MKIRVILCLVAIVMLSFFVWPFIGYRVWNIGNITGIVLGLLLLVYGIQREKIHKIAREKWKSFLGKTVMMLMGLLAGSGVLLVVVLSVCMFRGAAPATQQLNTVIVLGCKVKGNRPSLALEERLNKAYEYLEKNPEARCILSGGKGTDEDISEAQCMYDFLTEKGIAQERLQREEKSTSTIENFKFSVEMQEETGWKKEEKLLVITNEFHEYRARKIAKELGIETQACSAKTAWWLFPTFYLRELYGILYQIVFV